MISFSSNLKAYLCDHPVHMRNSFDGLAGIVRSSMKINPLDPYLFVFFNKNRDQIKILYWDRSGYAIWQKRLEIGRFGLSKTELDFAGLVMLLEGVIGNPDRRKKRFALPEKTA
ncbi:MAG: IS66 family insertion sequence element accessory protein TnpB [Deltaproteobacteria bacterium]|nr:IS66 family insertion sequence element accessory protein TnpB [Deltaproteobacteria bacterium]